jgi:nitrate reductase cytochrome c-type subunit
MMKRLILIASLAAGLAAAPLSLAQAQPVDDASLGLQKGSVYDVPTPQPFTLDGAGVKGSATGAFGAPPLVPHATAEYLPITADKNACLGCHEKPGAKKVKGGLPGIPPGHYAKGTGDKPRVSGDYYGCELCHAPAADVPDPVANKAPKPRR